MVAHNNQLANEHFRKSSWQVNIRILSGRRSMAGKKEKANISTRSTAESVFLGAGLG
jgi:hypothetical protein